MNKRHDSKNAKDQALEQGCFCWIVSVPAGIGAGLVTGNAGYGFLAFGIAMFVVYFLMVLIIEASK